MIGFEGTVTMPDDDLRASLGIPTDVVDAAIVVGPGSLRAFIWVGSGGPTGRETFARLSARLITRTPQVLWVLVAADAASDTITIGAPISGRRGARVVAVVVDRARVMDSDADTLRLLAAAQGADDLTTHGRFVEILGRDAISQRFFKTLDRCVSRLAASGDHGSAEARKEVALLYTSRLLFLGFLEAKGWLDNDPSFLSRAFDACMTSGGGFHTNVLLPLFFGTLNTPVSQRAARSRRFGTVPFLNGGLFTPTVSERVLKRMRFGDEALGHFFGELFSRYRFTAREESESFQEAAIDPEMLGRTFECLMAAQSRRASGAFYTPYELVERVTSCGLEHALAAPLGLDVAEEIVRGSGTESPVALATLTTMRILDPACGSGAFLVHLLERIATLRQQSGDLHPIAAIRRDVLTRSIFGVDINPTAVWLCQLRLWLSIVIDTDAAGTVPPLPNLDRNIRVGDSLAGEGFGDAPLAGGGRLLRQLRERYSRATGRRKASLSRLLDREERHMVHERLTSELASVSASRRDLVVARRGRNLFGERYISSREEIATGVMLRKRSTELRRRLISLKRGDALPFSFPAHFADVAANGGFSLVVGNPPWVRPHRLDVRVRQAFRQRFVVARSAPWAAGAAAAGAGHGFSAQVDLAALFVERSLQLLAQDAALSLLLPSKLWRSLAAGGLRHLVMNAARLARVEDYSDVPTSFDAAVYPGLLVAMRPSLVHRAAADPCTLVSVLHRSRMATTWTSRTKELAWDNTAGAPWILIPPEVRQSFDVLRARSIPLAASIFGRPLLGVKCGLNEAFVVRPGAVAGNDVCVESANGRRGHIEAATLRPVARGEAVRRWIAPTTNEAIIWTYDANGVVLQTLPPGVARWLTPYRRDLLSRSDARSASRWWSLFRTEAARADRPRVIWADIGRTPRATVLEIGNPTVPLNSCYIARCPSDVDALALAALINSPLIEAWLSVVAEPARGGYRRYLGWTMALLPVPIAWAEHRVHLAWLAGRARLDPEAVTRTELLEATIDAFGLTRRTVEPLLTWAAK